jgi:hypothetical protein
MIATKNEIIPADQEIYGKGERALSLTVKCGL